MVYLLITELLIWNSLAAISEDDSADNSLMMYTLLKEKYRGMATDEHWSEATRFFDKLVSEHREIAGSMVDELLNTGRHGNNLTYSAYDLVKCCYRLRQPVDDIIDDIALRNIKCV